MDPRGSGVQLVRPASTGTPSSQMFGGWWTKHRVDRICNHGHRQRRVWVRMSACIVSSPWLASATVFSVYHGYRRAFALSFRTSSFVGAYPAGLQPRGVVRRVCVVACSANKRDPF